MKQWDSVSPAAPALDESAAVTAPAGLALRAVFRAGRFYLRNALVVLPLVAVCALFVAFVLDQGRDVRRDLIISLCIGGSVWLVLDTFRYLLWRDARPPRAKFGLALLLLGGPAYYLGLLLAALALGENVIDLLPSTGHGLVAACLFALCVAMIGGWLMTSRAQVASMQLVAAEQRVRTANAEKAALQAQLLLLQTQIEPHMLFNTLANLQGLISIDPDRALIMLDLLIQYLRATLAASRAGSTTVAAEFAQLEAYLGLMSIRMGRRFSYTVEMPESLATQSIPSMLLQPLVENAIKHGIEPKLGGGAIALSARRQGARLYLSVADTGLGIGPDGKALHSKPGAQVGLDNVRERLAVLYGDRATFSLCAQEPAGAVATIILPLAL